MADFEFIFVLSTGLSLVVGMVLSDLCDVHLSSGLLRMVGKVVSELRALVERALICSEFQPTFHLGGMKPVFWPSESEGPFF
jgi:hypothetical protein